MADDVLQEFVVKLTTQIDNPGMQQIMKFLDSNKIKALGLASALTAATTAVYKFVESYTKEELSLRNLAKQKKKNLEQLRAEEAALKQMGVTLNDIKKDKALKSMYDDLVKFNKEMSLPNMDRAMEKVNGLRLAFYKFRSAVSYVVKAIGAQVLTNLEAPINRITGKLNNAANWIRDNLNQIAAKVGSVITAFAKGIIGIAETFEKIGKWVADLPAGIKAAGAAIIGVIGLLNSGPIGKILAAITLIGDIIHDYENFQWNKQNMEVPVVFQTPDGGHTSDIKKALIGEDGKPVAYQVRVGFTPIWEAVDEGKETGDIFTVIGTRLTEAMNNAFRDYDPSTLFGGGENNDGLIPKITAWLNKQENKEMLSDFGGALVGFITRGIETVGGTAGGFLAQIIDAIFGAGTADDTFWNDDGGAGTTLVGGLAGFFKGFAERLADPKNNKGLWDAFKEGMREFSIGSLISAFLTAIEENPQTGSYEINWEQFRGSLTAVGGTLFNMFSQALAFAAQGGSTLFSLIGNALSDSNFTQIGSVDTFIQKIGGVFSEWASDKTLMTGITTSVVTLFSGGNVFEAILTGIFGSFTSAREKAMRQALVNAGKYQEGDQSLAKLSIGVLEKEYESLDDEFKSDYWSNIFGDLGGAGANLVSGIWKALMAGVKGAENLAEDLWKMLMQTISSVMGFDSEEVANNVFGGVIVSTTAGTVLGKNLLTGLLAGVASFITGIEGKIDPNNPEYSDFITAVKTEAKGFWEQIMMIWYGSGEMVDGKWVAKNENAGLSAIFRGLFGEDNGGIGQTIREAVGKLLEPIKQAIIDVWDDIWLGVDEGNGRNGGLKGFVEKMFSLDDPESLINKVIAGLEPVGNAIVEWFNGLWIRIYNSGPQWLRDAFGFAGIKDPNTSTLSMDEEGNFVLTSTNEKSKVLTPEEAATISGIDVNTNNPEAGFGIDEKTTFNLSIDENDNIVGTNGNIFTMKRPFAGTDDYLYYNWHLPEKTKEENQRRRERNQRKIKKREDLMKWESDWEDQIDLDWYSQTVPDGDGLKPDGYHVPVKPDVDTKEVDDQLQKERYEIKVYGKLEFDAGMGDDDNGSLSGFGGALEHEALGGRMDHRQIVEVAEDGAEYIIPVTKTERAISLIMQMLNEMGSSAVSRIFDGLGIGQSGTIGANTASLSSAMQGMTINNNYNISAPVSINVNSSGASAEDIGTTAYNLAERHLVNTLRGAWA